MLTTDGGHSTGQGLCPGAWAQEPTLFVCAGRERRKTGTEVEPRQRHHLPWGDWDCALALFIYSCHVVHGSESAVEFLCLGFLWFSVTNGIFLWCLCLIQSLCWDCVGLFWFLFPCFPHCLSGFIVQYREAALASCEITHSPTLMKIHPSPPGIPEEMYSISQEHDCLVPCPQFRTKSSAPLSNMGGCPIYSWNRVPERVRCLHLVLSLSEIL